jgi:hypothetical protein
VNVSSWGFKISITVQTFLAINPFTTLLLLMGSKTIAVPNVTTVR